MRAPVELCVLVNHVMTAIWCSKRFPAELGQVGQSYLVRTPEGGSKSGRTKKVVKGIILGLEVK